MRLQSFNLLCLLVFANGSLLATPLEEFKKTINEEYSISADGHVDLSNKYGNIDVETWNENKVKIEVTVTVDAKSQEKANEVFDRIDVKMSNTTSLVRVATEINTQKNWKNWFGNNMEHFDIYFHIWVPASVSLETTNKYGDIYIAATQGEIDVVLKYGNLRMEGTDQDVSLDIGYGKARVGGGANVDLTMKYSKIEGGTFADVHGESKYSTFVADEVDALRVNTSYDDFTIKVVESIANVGKYDDFRIETLGSVNMSTKYTNLSVGSLSGQADFEFKYGGIAIDDLKSSFSGIDISSEYTGVKIGIDSDVNFALDAIGTHCSVRYSDLEVTRDIQKSSESTVVGYRGSQSAPKITARMRYGSLKLQ